MELFQVDDAGRLSISPIIGDWKLLHDHGINTIIDLEGGLDVGVPTVPNQCLYIYFPILEAGHGPDWPNRLVPLRPEPAVIGDFHWNDDCLAVAEDFQRYLLADLDQADEVYQMIGVVDGRAVELQDHVARTN